LGFPHAVQWGTPSLVCDFQELYRYLVDDFAIQYCRNLRKQDFIIANEDFSTNRKGKREYLNDCETRNLVERLNRYFQQAVNIPRMRMGNKQEIETLINEEAFLLAQYLRDEKQSWIPRILIHFSSASSFTRLISTSSG
jgi:CRISPR/Cas system-associated endonuclease Cas1